MTCAIRTDLEQECWIRLQGDLDATGCEEIAPRFREAVARSRARRIVVDLSAVGFITSRGIGLLVEAREHLRRRGASLTLAGLRPQVHRALETLGLIAILPIRPSAD